MTPTSPVRSKVAGDDVCSGCSGGGGGDGGGLLLGLCLALLASLP